MSVSSGEDNVIEPNTGVGRDSSGEPLPKPIGETYQIGHDEGDLDISRSNHDCACIQPVVNLLEALLAPGITAHGQGAAFAGRDVEAGGPGAELREGAGEGVNRQNCGEN